MNVFRGFQHPGVAAACALTIGNFDGVHRGHQTMLALLRREAQSRGLPSSVLTFEPHPRDWFAARLQKPDLAPARIGTLRDKLGGLAAAGIDQCIVLRFDAALAALSAQDFIDRVLVQGLHAKYLLVGDDFRFGAGRSGDHALLVADSARSGIEVARMDSFELQGLRVSSSAVRAALAAGDMREAAQLLGRPYAISGHVVHGARLGRSLGFRTLNLRFSHWKPAASGIFVVQVHGIDAQGALPGVANLGVRPSLDPHDANGGRVLLETHCLEWPASMAGHEAYGKIVCVELLHKLHDERRYDGLAALAAGIARDCSDARDWFDSQHDGRTRRQTTRDRI